MAEVKKKKKEEKTFFGSKEFMDAVKKRKKQMEQLEKEFPVRE